MDKHGTVFTKEALESGLKFINGPRKPRLGLEHNRTIPPLGRINNGEVVQGSDGAYYLIADQEFFDTIEKLTLPNGLELIRESCQDHNYPFTECTYENNENVQIQYDYVNFQSYENCKDFIKNLKSENELDFEESSYGRKAEIPDPEIVIRLTEILVIALGISLRKIPEKLGEAVGDDLVKFYKLLTNTIKKSVQELIPKKRPIHFVVELPIEKSVVELIVITRDADLAINAFNQAVISQFIEEIKICIIHFNAEKIQYILNENKVWELNYLLTNDGKVIGTKKAFKRRDDFFQEMVEKEIEKKSKNNA